MIAIPDDTLKERFNSGLIRGNVLRTLINFPLHVFKRLLLLNNDFNQEEIYYFLTTSKVQWYIDNKESRIVKYNSLYFKKGETSNNISEDMVIDCRKVFTINKSDLFSSYKNLKLDFLNEFSEEIMNKINQIIKNSKLIAPKCISKISI